MLFSFSQFGQAIGLFIHMRFVEGVYSNSVALSFQDMALFERGNGVCPPLSFWFYPVFQRMLPVIFRLNQRASFSFFPVLVCVYLGLKTWTNKKNY